MTVPLPTIPVSKVLRDVGNPDLVEIGEVVVYDAYGLTPMGFGRDVIEARRDALHTAGVIGVPAGFLDGQAFRIVKG